VLAAIRSEYSHDAEIFERFTLMAKTLKVGVIGVGGIAGTHFPAGKKAHTPNSWRFPT
jgi:hypothetical protein